MCSLVLGSGSDGSVPLTFSAPFWRPGRPPFQKGEAASRTGSSRAQKTTQWCSAFCADNLERFSWSVQRGRDRTVVDAISAAVESMIEASNMPMSGTDEKTQRLRRAAGVFKFVAGCDIHSRCGLPECNPAVANAISRLCLAQVHQMMVVKLSTAKIPRKSLCTGLLWCEHRLC